MSAAQLMTDLARLGIRIEAHGDQLRYSPRSAVPPDLVDRMKTHKVEVLEILQRDAEAPEIDPTDATQVWLATLDRLEGNPLFPTDVIEALRAADARWADDEAVDVRCRCGSTKRVEVNIHNGHSSRLDCAKCGRFIECSRWQESIDC